MKPELIDQIKIGDVIIIEDSPYPWRVVPAKEPGPEHVVLAPGVTIRNQFYYDAHGRKIVSLEQDITGDLHEITGDDNISLAYYVKI